MRVLVLGAGGPAGSNFCKSLRISNNQYYIVGTDCNPYHVHFMEQFVDKGFLIHKATQDMYYNDIRSIVEDEEIDVIYAQSDTEVKYLSLIVKRLAQETGVKYCLPSAKTIMKCQNKQTSGKIWEQNPPYLFSDPVKINEVKKSFDLIESDQIWIRASHGAGGKASFCAKDIESAYHWIRFWQVSHPNVSMIAQRYIKGKNIAWQSVWYNGELITSQARERLEYIYPHLNPSGITGTPVVAKTIHDPEVNIACVEAVKKISPRPHGVFCVDLIKDKKNKCYITEINCGRFFTTSYFFAYAGMKHNVVYANMPDLLMQLAKYDFLHYIEKYNFKELRGIKQINILPYYQPQNYLP